MIFNKKNTRRSFIKNISAAGIGSIGTADFLYQLPPQTESIKNNGKNAVILFQGDSITDGNRSRNNDWNHIMGHGYAYLIASRLWYNQPGKNFHFFNRGISGNTVADLAARWQTDTIDIKPDVLSILIGVNDVNNLLAGGNNGSAEQFEEKYRSILHEAKEKLPDLQLVLCEPFILPVGKIKDRWDEWSVEMKKTQATVAKMVGEFNAIYISLQNEFDKALEKAPPEYWIWDGIHPMPAGHELIARKWIRTVQKKLPNIW